MKVHHFHVPGKATCREYAVYLIVARHRKTRNIRVYVGKTGDNREGCNPLISRAGNHLSYNPIHSQSRNHLGNTEEFDFDFYFTTFGPYVSPAKSRHGIDLVNEMERQLNVLSQKAFGEIVNPLKLSAYVPPAERNKRRKLVTPERIGQLQQLIDEAKKLIEGAPKP